MTNQELTNRLNNITKGAFVRIKYMTELPVQAAQKHHYNVYKIVEQTVRIGVNYNNIQRVKAKVELRADTPTKEYTNPYKQVFKNMIYQHEKTGTQYLQFATVPNNAHVKTKYVVIDAVGIIHNDYTKQDVINADIVLPSYWKEHEVPEVQKVKIENIISL